MTRETGRVPYPPEGWWVLQLSSRRLWVARALELSATVEKTAIRAVGPTEAGWDDDALLIEATWEPARVSPLSRLPGRPEFRPSMDIALVHCPESHGGLSDERKLASLGSVDRFLGRFEDLPGLPTVTPGHHRRLGLHLDNWDRLLAAERHQSRNRVGLNLGPDARTLLAADLDISSTCTADAVPTTISLRRHLHHDQAALPPVICLDIPPGWAYIAPTENLLHDASSLRQRRGATHTMALGDFCLSPVPEEAIAAMKAS